MKFLFCAASNYTFRGGGPPIRIGKEMSPKTCGKDQNHNQGELIQSITQENLPGQVTSSNYQLNKQRTEKKSKVWNQKSSVENSNSCIGIL